jgi:hypothetical protein
MQQLTKRRRTTDGTALEGESFYEDLPDFFQTKTKTTTVATLLKG